MARSKKVKQQTEEKEFAAMTFEAWDIKLDELPTNEQFGMRMVQIRVAALTLAMEKPKVVDLVRKLDAGAGFAEGSNFIGMMDGINDAKKALSAFVEMLGVAEARLLVGASVIALEPDGTAKSVVNRN